MATNHSEDIYTFIIQAHRRVCKILCLPEKIHNGTFFHMKVSLSGNVAMGNDKFVDNVWEQICIRK
jgi:hypothetical protein